LIISSRGYRGIYPPVGGKFFKGILVMARYEHLPIYKKAMETAVYFEKIVRGFSRYNKYTLGSELRAVSRDILKLIIRDYLISKRACFIIVRLSRPMGIIMQAGIPCKKDCLPVGPFMARKWIDKMCSPTTTGRVLSIQALKGEIYRI
jgi:hypothetical protein